MSDDPVSGISRETLIQGHVQKLAQTRDGPASSVLSFEELKASRRAFLPDDYNGPDIWIFGYGSLIWNPLVDFDAKCAAHLFGYHRRFCLWTRIGRGSPECPGLVLALDRGGSVNGIAFRIPAGIAVRELDMLWRREMLTNSYLPRFVSIHTDEGKKRALTFIIKRDTPGFAEKMSDEHVSDIIARASGFIGPCAQYLLETERALQNFGIADQHMTRLASMVKTKMTALSPDKSRHF